MHCLWILVANIVYIAAAHDTTAPEFRSPAEEGGGPAAASSAPVPAVSLAPSVALQDRHPVAEVDPPLHALGSSGTKDAASAGSAYVPYAYSGHAPLAGGVGSGVYGGAYGGSFTPLSASSQLDPHAPLALDAHAPLDAHAHAALAHAGGAEGHAHAHALHAAGIHHPRGHPHALGDAAAAGGLFQEHHYAEHDLEEAHHEKKSAARHIAMGFLAYMAVLAVLQSGLIALTRGVPLWNVARRRRDLTRVHTIDPASVSTHVPPSDPTATDADAAFQSNDIGGDLPTEQPHAERLRRPLARDGVPTTTRQPPPHTSTDHAHEKESAEADNSASGGSASNLSGPLARRGGRCLEHGVCSLSRQLSAELGNTGKMLARYISVWAGVSLATDVRRRLENAGDAGLHLGDCDKLYPGCSSTTKRT